MIRKSRDLTLDAMDQGWSGPPFDPLQLADILKITVVPSQNVLDARSVPLGRKALQIEFNPARPKGRLRFSIAHEIAHSFFPDCGERVRNRSSHQELTGDDWQLETLCNIGAAELIMPIGSIASNTKDEIADLGIDNILELRKRYDVSMEALLMRVVRLAEQQCAMFCASRPEKSNRTGRYRLDYMITSRSWPQDLSRTVTLPEDSVLTECTAIGYTAKGTERWFISDNMVQVECVGIPAFPGGRFPRVAGIIRTLSQTGSSPSGLTYLKGDALEPRGGGFKIIAHIVNDRTANWGGRGFAAAVRKRLPHIQQDFKNWASLSPDKLSLGNLHSMMVDDSTMVVHMIAQKGYGPSAKPRIRYKALETCLEFVSDIAKGNNASLHMPRIGTGYAGGTWAIIEEMLLDQLCQRGISVTVYDLPGAVSSS
jgi:Zn-dependent peptidase ImmA (M78 family)/O-acetyl-ADP-ribose deacetylase (regulator of RNase III)